MGTYMVVGAYQFVGFHLTQHLLEEGEEVIGIDWEDFKTNRDLEEKELEIGRNANFTYFPISKLRLLDVSERFTMILSDYDSRKGNASLTDSQVEDLLTFLGKCQRNQADNLEIIILLPIDSNPEDDQPLLKACEGFTSVKRVFLPTIYGPWQPKSMGFEAARRQLERSTLDSIIASEFREDALFIGDFLDDFNWLLSSKEKDIQLCSSIEEHWGKCAKLVFNEEVLDSLPTQRPQKAKKGTIHKVLNKTSPEEGIRLQIEHNKRRMHGENE